MWLARRAQASAVASERVGRRGPSAPRCGAPQARPARKMRVKGACIMWLLVCSPATRVRFTLVGTATWGGGFRPLGLGWDGYVVASFAASPAGCSPGSPSICDLALDLLDTAPGAPGSDPGGAAAAVTTAVTAVLRSRPDGAVRTLTRAVRAWFVSPGPRPRVQNVRPWPAVTGRDRRDRPWSAVTVVVGRDRRDRCGPLGRAPAAPSRPLDRAHVLFARELGS